MVVLPPGTILQLMYLEARLKRIPSGRFIEVGGRGKLNQSIITAWLGGDCL